MFRLIWAASVRTHDILRQAPTNLLISATRTRRGLRWGIPAMLLALPYWSVASWCITIIDRSGPGWLNLLVLLATCLPGFWLCRLCRGGAGRRRESRPSCRHNRGLVIG